MTESSDSLRLILGLKLRNLRLARGEGLREVAARAGLSVSYLSEVEQGKKYPKPDKLLRLAAALEIAYDDLVSSKVTAELGPLKGVWMLQTCLSQRWPGESFTVSGQQP